MQNSINSIVPLAILLVRYFVFLGFISNYILAAVKALATILLAEEDYKMKCVEYFISLSDDCKNIRVAFPYFNLLFLGGWLAILLGIQFICMLRHRLTRTDNNDKVQDRLFKGFQHFVATWRISTGESSQKNLSL